MKRTITITYTATLTVQPATGPNIRNQPLEVIDADGDRVPACSPV